MTDPAPKPCWYRLTPDRIVIGLLIVEGLLWLSERFQWFGVNNHKGWTVLIAVSVVGVVVLVTLLWLLVALLFRWRFQFSIRSLLVMTVVVAMPFSWLSVEMNRAKKQRDAAAVFRNCGGTVEFGWMFHWTPNAGPKGQVWLNELLGEDFFNDVVFVAGVSNDASMQSLKGTTSVEAFDLSGTQITDAGLQHLAGMSQLDTLSLDNTRVTNAGLVHLAGLPRLQRLCLRSTAISDAGLQHLAGMSQLETLSLDNTRVTNAGLVHLAGLTHLEGLWLDETQITDAGLGHLKGLSQLQDLYLLDTRITTKGVADLQKALPNCRIVLGR